MWSRSEPRIFPGLTLDVGVKTMAVEIVRLLDRDGLSVYGGVIGALNPRCYAAI
jgi:hypothetical protein